MNKKSFEARMFSIAPIKPFGLDEQQFGKLTQVDQRNLLQSRSTLIALLRAIQNNQNALVYVTTDMAKKYKTSRALAAGLVAPETSIMATGISEFETVDSRTLKLHFFALVFSEG